MSRSQIILISIFFIHSHLLALKIVGKNESEYYSLKSDSAKKKWITTPYLTDSIGHSLSNTILKNDSVFIEKWVNNVLFVYDDVKHYDIPDNLNLKLIKNDEKFQFTWYGVLYSGYGKRGRKFHRGMDIYLNIGDTVASAFDGVVRFARFNKGGYGNCVIVRHLNGLETLYGHLSAICVAENQFVRAGNLIGLGGNTGKSFGSHLHFETRYKDFSFDPNLIINISNQTIKDSNIVINKSNILSYRYPSKGKKITVKKNKKNLKKVKNGLKGSSRKKLKQQQKKSSASFKKQIKKSTN